MLYMPSLCTFDILPKLSFALAMNEWWNSSRVVAASDVLKVV